MIRIKTYRKIEPEILSSPILSETLRFDLESSDFVLDALSRLILYMLRDGKSTADIVEVTLLSRSIIEDNLFRLRENGFLENTTLSMSALTILQRNAQVDSLNKNSTQIYFDSLKQQKISSLDSIKISATQTKSTVAEILTSEVQIPFEGTLPEGISCQRIPKKILYAERPINFLPSLGGSIFEGCVELDCAEFFVAEIPVRVYDVAGRKIIVELLIGTIPNVDEKFLDADATPVIRFNPNPAFNEYYCDKKIMNLFGANSEIPVHNDGVSYLRAEISKEMVGDFLCE